MYYNHVYINYINSYYYHTKYNYNDIILLFGGEAEIPTADTELIYMQQQLYSNVIFRSVAYIKSVGSLNPWSDESLVFTGFGGHHQGGVDGTFIQDRGS